VNPLTFQYEALPARVVFGAGTLSRLPEEAARLQLRRVLILSTAGHRANADRVGALLGPLAAEVFAGAVMHTPGQVTEVALALASRLQIDGLIAIGGGSAIGSNAGRSFTGSTMTVKVRLIVSPPPLSVPPLSVTVTVMCAAPLAFGAGV